MKLCLNCLAAGDCVEVDVGPEKGSQRDPYRQTLSLCPECAEALVSGDLATFADRHESERTIRR